MSSNLPPGVTDSMIPGNRPEDQAYEELFEGEVGDLLFELAKLSLPDVTEHRFMGKTADLCKRCFQVIPSDERDQPTCPWPPFDVRREIAYRLEALKRELERA